MPPIRVKEKEPEEFGENALNGHDMKAAIHGGILQRGVQFHDHGAQFYDEEPSHQQTGDQKHRQRGRVRVEHEQREE